MHVIKKEVTKINFPANKVKCDMAKNNSYMEEYFFNYKAICYIMEYNTDKAKISYICK